MKMKNLGTYRVFTALPLAVSLGFSSSVSAETRPLWWDERPVFSNLSVDDFAIVNHGQLKHIATQAHAELQSELGGGAGAAISNLVATWSAPSNTRDDFAPINVGQLKSIARLFYDRLGLPYPWAAAPLNAADDFAAVNVGQLKRIFSFDPQALYSNAADSDQDGLPDWLELAHGSDVNSPDSNGNGVTDAQEYWDGLDGTHALDGTASYIDPDVRLVVTTPNR